MRSVLAIAFIGLSFTAGAQGLSAEDWFNTAAKQYVKQDKATALRTLDAALREHPGDPRLLRLAEELLKEQPPQQQPQPQGGQNGQQDQQQQEQGRQDANNREQKRQQDAGEQHQRNGDRQRQQQERISAEDARRILDALDRQEKDVQDKVQEQMRPAQRRGTEKDW